MSDTIRQMSENTCDMHMLRLPQLHKCKMNNQPDGCSSPLCATAYSGSSHFTSYLMQVDPVENSMVIQTVVTNMPHKHAADSAVALYGSR